MNDLKIIDGKLISMIINKHIKLKIKKYINKKKQRLPKLIIIQIGNDQKSNIYIKNKQKACEYVGILFELHKYDINISQKRLIKYINNFNKNQTIDGIIIQLPLPKHIDVETIINKINILKDADGCTPNLLGNLVISNNNKIVSATTKGIITLLKYYGISLESKHVVIIGRSNIVGKPLANFSINSGATVTVCNSKTKKIKKFTKKADILISAVGKPKIIKKNMIKHNSIIIDVGINYDENNKICGDVDFDNVIKKVKMITPVPGGVGPMTITSLLENVLSLYEMHIFKKNGK